MSKVTMWSLGPRAVSITRVRGEPLYPALDDHVSQGLSTPTASAAHGPPTVNPCTGTRPDPQEALSGGKAARREGAFRRKQGSPARQSALQGSHARRWLGVRLLEVRSRKETMNRRTCSSVLRDVWGRAASPGSRALGARTCRRLLTCLCSQTEPLVRFQTRGHLLLLPEPVPTRRPPAQLCGVLPATALQPGPTRRLRPHLQEKPGCKEGGGNDANRQRWTWNQKQPVKKKRVSRGTNRGASK